MELSAFGKIGAGYLDGNKIALGSYDECHSLSPAQYCLAELEISNEQQEAKFLLMYAMCLPRICHEDDIGFAVNATSFKLAILLRAREINCESESKASYNAGSIIILFVWCLFALVVAVATVTQFVTRKNTGF